MPTVWPTMDGTNRYPQGQTSRTAQIFQMYGPSRLGHRPIIGEGGFPCGGRKIHASWESAAHHQAGGGGDSSGVSIATNASGMAVLWLRLLEPPGQYDITLTVVGAPYLSDNVTVEVRQCWKGEEERRPGVCRVCPAGSYNLQPGRCEECLAHAECAGGSAVLPQPGFWLSSPQHNVAHR
jgi:hypothetical protein